MSLFQYVKLGWLVLDLFFLQLVLLFLRKSSILFEFEGPQPLTGELLSHCSCHMPGRCNDRQRGARHDVLFCEHLLFVPWQIRKGTLGQAKLLFQNLWSWFKRLTCSDLSHSPEDAVILIILRRMSLSTPVFSWTYIWLSWTYIIAAFTDIRHSPSTNTLTNLHKSHWKSSVLFLKDIAGYLKDIAGYGYRRAHRSSMSSPLPQRRVLGPVACPIASYCNLHQAQHEWNGRKFWRVPCSPSSNGSMLGPIKLLIVRSSFCLGFPTARLCRTAGCNKSPTLLSCVWAAPETDCACFILRLSWYHWPLWKWMKLRKNKYIYTTLYRIIPS